MKTIKYLVAGALLIGMSAPAMAQDVNYKDEVKNIEAVVKANPTPAASADLLKKYKKTFKKDAKALVELGKVYMHNKLYDQATELANLAMSRDKSYGDAYILLGDIAASQDDGGTADMWYTQCMTIDPKNPEGYLKHSSVNRKVAPEESEKALQKLKEILPDYPIDATLAEQFLQAGNLSKAYDYFVKVDQNKIEEYQLVDYIGTVNALNKKDEALALSTVGTQRFPKDFWFHRAALRFALELRKAPESLSFAQSIVSNDTLTRVANDYVQYGQALALNQKFNEAIEQYNKALSMDAKNTKTYQYISEAYTGLNQEDKALEYSQKYMENYENVVPSDFAKLAGIYLQKVKAGKDKEANFDKAIAVYESVAKKWPQLESWAYLQAGIQGTQNGFDDKGAGYLQKVVDLLSAKGNDITADEKGTLISALQNLGYYYWGTKSDLESAKPYYEKLLQLSPEDKNAKAALGIDQPTEGEAAQ